MAHEKIIKISDSNFEEEVIKSNIPVLVDFWAEWCAPCKMVEPTLESIADEYNGRIKVGRLNVDENPESASKYRITSIPSLLFFKDNKVVDMLVGAVPKEYIKDVIDRIL